MKYGAFLFFFCVPGCLETSSNFLENYKTAIEVIPAEEATNFRKKNATSYESDVVQSYFKNDQWIKIETIAEGEQSQKIDKIISARIVYIGNLFAPRTVPYQGTISKTMKCLNQNQHLEKVFENDLQKKYTFNLAATGKFVFGVCDEDLEIYRTNYTILYCKKQKKLYDIKHFYPKNLKVLDLSFDCYKN